MLAPHPLQAVADRAATSQWDPHRILALAESLLLARAAPAAFLLFPWDHRRILTWAQEVPLVLEAQCHQDIQVLLVDRWALEDLWAPWDLADLWEVQWVLEDQ